MPARQQVAPERHPVGDNWHAGHVPSQAQQWAIEVLAKAGTLAIIGVCPPSDTSFPTGIAMNKNLTIRMGKCNHRKYIPKPLELIRGGHLVPTVIVTQHEPWGSVIDAYKAFDTRQPGWLKVALTPSAGAANP